MTNKNIFIGLIIILIGYFSYSKIFKNNDEKVIIGIIDDIQKQAEFDNPLKKMDVYSRIQNIKKHTKKDIILKAFQGERILADINSFEDIQAGIFIGSKYLAKHKTYVTETSFDIVENTAKVDLVLVSEGTEQSKVNSFRELFSVTLDLVKTEDFWLIKNVIAERQTEQ